MMTKARMQRILNQLEDGWYPEYSCAFLMGHIDALWRNKQIDADTMGHMYEQALAWRRKGLPHEKIVGHLYRH